MRSLKLFFAREWGALWFLVFCIPAVLRFWTASYGGHYEVFREASLSLWNHSDPYLIHHPSGYFLYHPACALFFFGAFNVFSPVIANFLLMALGLFCVFFAMRFCSHRLNLSEKSRNFFFFLATSEILGAIQNSRLEVYIVAALFFAMASLIHGNLKRSALVLAIPSVFKLQALAFVGLISIAVFKDKNKRLWILWISLFLLAVAASPLLVFQAAEYFHYLTLMQQRLSDYLPQVFASYQHIFRFISLATPFEIQLGLATQIAAVLAAGMSLFCMLIPASNKVRLEIAIGLSAIYVTSFSLMSQSAAYCLALPLVMLAIKEQKRSRLISIGIWGSWILMSFLYSDLTPKEIRHAAFDLSIKSLGPIWLGFFWLLGMRSTWLKTSQP